MLISCLFLLGSEVTRMMNLTVTTVWVSLRDVFCSCVWDFYSRG